LWFGIVGALLGAAVGYVAFFTLLNRAGLYAMVLPGALIGIGRVMGSKTKSIPLGIVCGVAAVVLSLYLEWRVTPLPEGATFIEFLQRLPDRPFRSQASLIAGPLMALWFGLGRSESHANDVE
jgi:hypothetical protein